MQKFFSVTERKTLGTWATSCAMDKRILRELIPHSHCGIFS